MKERDPFVVSDERSPKIKERSRFCFFLKLLKDNPPLRKNRLQKDMRIAAIALSVGATIVTCNQ